MTLVILLFCVLCPFSPIQASPESILKQMTLEEKIGQLFMAGLYSNREDALSEGQQEDPVASIEKLITEYHIGGVLFKKRWDTEKVRYQTRRLQKLSKIPLFCAVDAEWGLRMRMADALNFPKNQALGTLENEALLFAMGREIGRQCQKIGINWNFAPVVDINTNPHNPIIHDRSFGGRQSEVARKGVLMMQGLQSEGILAAAKHFPGHGDTAVDSHTGLPVLRHEWPRLYGEELVPFITAIKNGVKSMMSGHLLVPVLDDRFPASLSPKVIKGLLQKQLGFQGLTVTDDLLMGAIAKNYSPQEAALLAFLAGNDVILSSKDIEISIAAIKKGMEEGRVKEEEINARVRKILAAKEWIARRTTYSEDALFNQKAANLKKLLYHAVVHIERDRKGLLPLASTKKCAFLQTDGPLFTHDQAAEVTVIALTGMNQSYQDNFGVSKAAIHSINQRSRRGKNVVVVIFGNASISSQIDEQVSVVLGYEEDPDAKERAAKLMHVSPNLLYGSQVP